MHEGRWVIQLVVLVFWIAVLIVSRIVYRQRFEWRYCLRNLMPWFAHIALFFAVSLVRMAVMGSSIFILPWMSWWLGAMSIHGALAFLGVFHYILKNGY